MMESGETLLNNHWLGNREGSLSFLVGTISNVLVMEIGWTDVGSWGVYLSELCSQYLLVFTDINFINNYFNVFKNIGFH